MGDSAMTEVCHPVKQPLYTPLKQIELAAHEDKAAFDELFVKDKNCPGFPPFTERSGNRCKLHYHDPDIVLLESKGVLHQVSLNTRRSVAYQTAELPDFSISAINSRYAILKAKPNMLAVLDQLGGVAKMCSFEWDPFRVALAEDRWFVATRQTYNGPGHLYSFAHDGRYLWGLEFLEEFNTFFGLIKATAYHLRISDDKSELLVSTMDRIYRFSLDGKLLSRIAVSTLREEDQNQEKLERQKDLPKNPRTRDELIEVIASEYAEKIVGQFTAPNLSDPPAGFVQDPKTHRVFVLETQGRISAWDPVPAWTLALNEPARCFFWVAGQLVVALANRACLWIDPDGHTLLSVRDLPGEVKEVLQAPDIKRQLLICGSRFVEVDLQSGSWREGPEARAGSEVFEHNGRMLFYDGSYLWRAAENASWEMSTPVALDQAPSIPPDSIGEAVAVIPSKKPFRKIWEITPTSIGTRYIASSAFDGAHKLIYVNCPKRYASDQEKEYELNYNAHQGQYGSWQEVICYDFSVVEQWATPFFGDITSIDVSPEGDAVFIALRTKGIATDPAELLVLTGDGTHKYQTPCTVRGATFSAPDLGKLMLFGGEKHLVVSRSNGWMPELAPPPLPSTFGSGLNSFSAGGFVLSRKGPKLYTISGPKASGKELKFSAAVHDAVVMSSTGHLIIRIGNLFLKALDASISPVWDVKLPERALAMVAGPAGILVLTDGQVIFVDVNGNPRWKFASPPGYAINQATYLSKRQAFLWQVASAEDFQITLLSPKGVVLNSDTLHFPFHARCDLDADETVFVIHSRDHIECHGMD